MRAAERAQRQVTSPSRTLCEINLHNKFLRKQMSALFFLR